MYILKQTPNVIGHNVTDITVEGEVAHVVLHSKALSPTEATGMIWINSFEVPVGALGDDEVQGAADWLVTNHDYFIGAVALSDDAFEITKKKVDIHAAVKAARDVHEQAGCATPSGRVDTDPDSQRKIGGAATMALALGASFTMDWRMADNSIVTLDASGMIALGEAVAEHVAACQARKNALDAAIDAATTLDELAAIDPEQGWPSLQ